MHTAGQFRLLVAVFTARLRDTSLPTVADIAGRHAHGYIVFGDPPADLDVTRPGT